MVWISGNKGMLGTELSILLEKNGLPFFGTGREVDITSFPVLRDYTSNKKIDWIINCAAYTAVDKAEDDAKACYMVNTLGAANVAECTKSIGARLIHISTDYVFDGKRTIAERTMRPHQEDDETNPAGVYALTKRDGELAILKNNPSSYVIRRAWLYGKYGNNFVNTMLRLMNERDEIKVVDDQRGSPTWAFDLASVVISVIKTASLGKDIPFGIYHYTNEGDITWFDFAKEIYRQGREQGCIKKDCAVNPCTSVEYQIKAKRPAYAVLDVTKIRKTIDIDIPDWKTSLAKYLELIS